MKRITAILLCVVICLSLFGCNTASDKDKDKVQIVTTIFPLYDFARQIGGDKVKVTLLLPTGAEVHSYEPTPKDIISIKESDLFIKLGDEVWASSVIKDSEGVNVLTAMDMVELIMDGHEHEGHSSIVHTDPHIWTTPKNAQIISQSICDSLCRIDEKNGDYYRENAKKYNEELSEFDEKFTALTNGKKVKMAFADQFPFRYFTEAYDIEYYAAFPGCSSESEPSAATVANLIEMVKKEKLPVVFYTETSNKQLPGTICDETGAPAVLFHSYHTVTDNELKSNITYVDLMRKNYEALKKAI